MAIFISSLPQVGEGYPTWEKLTPGWRGLSSMEMVSLWMFQKYKKI
jgi:hypothetical protein